MEVTKVNSTLVTPTPVSPLPSSHGVAAAPVTIPSSSGSTGIPRATFHSIKSSLNVRRNSPSCSGQRWMEDFGFFFLCASRVPSAWSCCSPGPGSTPRSVQCCQPVPVSGLLSHAIPVVFPADPCPPSSVAGVAAAQLPK